MNLNKQTLKPLPSEIRSIVRSGINISSVAQCVVELVFNSIDAGAKNIHIGINLDQFNVRVEDDGNGLNEVDLEAVGVTFTTSKCSTLIDLNNLRFYGFRGEALASIIDVSNTVDIITRPQATVGIELKKKYENGTVQGFIEKHNTQAKKSGTTIVVGKLLSKLPVRQQRIDKSLQLEEVKSSLEKIALINPTLSIELRNEKNGTQLFSFKPSNCYAEAINQMFMSRIGFEVKFVQEHFLHKKFFLNLSVSYDFVKKKHYQFVFLNNRYIRRCRIHKWIGNFILDRQKDSSSPSTDKYPIFIFNITCPFSEYDITLEPKKQTVEFKDWDALCVGIDGLILKLRQKNSLVTVDKKVQSVDKNTSLVSSYDVKGALHSRFVAREVDVPSNKSPCTDSDRGSVGKIFVPVKKSRNPRNLTRTGHSTHVVNVRDIRKKRKLQLQSPPRAAKCPPQPAVSKPRLTMGTFERFPEWKGEFDKSAPLPPKRFKDSATVANHNEQDDEAAAGFKWKVNRFFQTYQQGASVTAAAAEGEVETPGTISESVQSIKSMDSMLHPQSEHSQSSNRLKNNVSARPKSPEFLDHSDVEDCIFHWSAMVSKKHFEKKWTFKSAKADIINRLMKYYKASVCSKKTKPFTTANSSNKQTTSVPSVPVTVVPTENHQVLCSHQQDLITPSSFSANVKQSCECERKCTSNPPPSKPSYLKPSKLKVPSFGNSGNSGNSGTPAKVRKLDSTLEEEEGYICLICYNPFTNSGEHRLSCLACGHIFGKSCITKWLKGAASCPQCNNKARTKDIRVLYTKQLQALDTAERDRALKDLESTKQLKQQAELEIAKMKLLNQSKDAEIVRLPEESRRYQSQIQQLEAYIQNSVNATPSQTKTALDGIKTQVAGPSSSGTSGLPEVLFTRCGSLQWKGKESRVAAYSEWSNAFVVSHKFTNGGLFGQYGVRILNWADMKASNNVPLHQKEIRDMTFSPNQTDLLLSVGMDSKAHLTNVHNSLSVLTFSTESPLWSCAFSSVNPNIFYVGMANGQITSFDIRNPKEALGSLNFPSNDKSPVCRLHFVPSSYQESEFSACGLLVQKLNSCWFIEFHSETEIKFHQLPVDGPFLPLDFEQVSRHLLISVRPSPKNPTCQHLVCRLTKAPSFDGTETSYTCDIIKTFKGAGTVGKLYRPKMFSPPDSSGKVFVMASKSSSQVSMWDLSEFELKQSFSVSDIVLDYVPVKYNNDYFLNFLTNDGLESYKYVSV